MSYEHMGTGLKMTRMMNGVPTIITDDQAELRMDVLERGVKGGQIEDFIKLRDLYIKQRDALKSNPKKNKTAINHFDDLAKTAARLIKKLQSE